METERIVAVGIDLVGLARVRAAFRRHGSSLVDRVCAPAEARAIHAGACAADGLAIRFAYKEAVLKALGTGWADGLAFRQVETDPERPGGGVSLTGAAARRAERLGIRRWVGDASKSDRAVLAWVAAIGADPATPDRGARRSRSPSSA